jgi:tetratricopeptide (TPR) repeat protein
MNKYVAVLALVAAALAAQQPATVSAQQPATQQSAGANTQQPANSNAQQPSAGQQGQQAQAGAAANAGPHPKSQAELDALKKLIPELQNGSTPAQTIDQDVQGFVTKYPDSDYKEAVYSLAMEYYRSHNDYLKMLEYGETVLKVNPNSLQALVSLAGAIPQRVKETDLDRDERLAQADAYNHRALQIVDHLGPTFNGRTLTEDQQKTLKNMVHANVYSSEALIAYDRKQYQQAITNYGQAIPLDEPSNAAVDYYHMAQAQEELKQFDQASASLDKAQQFGASSPALQSVVKIEREKIARATGKPVAAPMAPQSTPAQQQPATTAQPPSSVPQQQPPASTQPSPSVPKP